MTFRTPTAAERGDRNLLAVLESLRAGKLNRPDLLAEHEAEAQRRGIAHLRAEDIPLPPIGPMPWEVHDGCTWQQVGPCVYCADHNERLYQGRVPASRDPEQAQREAECAERGHDWDPEMGQGFYFVCQHCGTKEWTE